MYVSTSVMWHVDTCECVLLICVWRCKQPSGHRHEIMGQWLNDDQKLWFHVATEFLENRAFVFYCMFLLVFMRVYMHKHLCLCVAACKLLCTENCQVSEDLWSVKKCKNHGEQRKKTGRFKSWACSKQKHKPVNPRWMNQKWNDQKLENQSFFLLFLKSVLCLVTCLVLCDYLTFCI